MWRRLLVFGCAASASLALASGAPAQTPQLLVSGATEIGASAATVIRVKEEKTDAAPFRTSIYLPSGYVANLGQSAGTQVGTVTMSLQQLALSPDAIDVAGTIRTDTPSKYAGNLCAPGTHRAVWLLHLVVQGATFDVPAYVDPATGNDATFSSAKIVLCLSNPYEQAAPGTRAPFGVRFVDTRMTLSAGVFTNPIVAGSFVWRAVITPWTANAAAEDATGTIEAQSMVNIPSLLSLRAKVRTIRYTKHGRETVTNSVLLSGKLLEDLNGVAGARVTFYANGKTAGSAPTAASGVFSRTTGLATRMTLKATATVPTRATDCANPLPATAAPAGCVAATIAGYKLSSNTVTAMPKKR
jgi:hypothetical protein